MALSRVLAWYAFWLILGMLFGRLIKIYVC